MLFVSLQPLCSSPWEAPLKRTIPFATAERLVIPLQIKLERASGFTGETLNRMTPPGDTRQCKFYSPLCDESVAAEPGEGSGVECEQW